MRYIHIRRLRDAHAGGSGARAYIFEADSEEEYAATIAMIDEDPDTIKPSVDDAEGGR